MKYRIFPLKVELAQGHPLLKDSIYKARGLGYTAEESLDQAKDSLSQQCRACQLTRIADFGSPTEFRTLADVPEPMSRKWLKSAVPNGSHIELY